MKCGCDHAGERNRRVTVESPSGTADAAGHVDLTIDSSWTDEGQRWAKVITRGGSESRVFNQVQAETTHIVEMNSDGLTRTIIPKWRLKLGNRNLNITAAYDVDDQRQTVRCECIEAR